MTLLEFLKVQRVLRDLAARSGVSVLETRLEIQLAIDEGWQKSQADPEALERWQQLFPSGRKPSVEEFICRLGQEMSAGNNPPYLLG